MFDRDKSKKKKEKKEKNLDDEQFSVACCTECQFACDTQKELQYHMNTCHAVRCLYKNCRETFTGIHAKRNRRTHVEVIHGGKKHRAYYTAHCKNNPSCVKNKAVETPPDFYCSCCGKRLKTRNGICHHRLKKALCSGGVAVTTKPQPRRIKTPSSSLPVSPQKPVTSDFKGATGVKRSLVTPTESSTKRTRLEKPFVIPIKVPSSTVTSGAFDKEKDKGKVPVDVDPYLNPVPSTSRDPESSTINTSGVTSEFQDPASFIQALMNIMSAYVGPAATAANAVPIVPTLSNQTPVNQTPLETTIMPIPDATPVVPGKSAPDAKQVQVSRHFKLKITRMKNDPNLRSYLKKANDATKISDTIEKSTKIVDVVWSSPSDDSEDEFTDDDDDDVFKKPSVEKLTVPQSTGVTTSTPRLRVLPLTPLLEKNEESRDHLIVDPLYLEQRLTAIQRTVSRMNIRLKKIQQDVKLVEKDIWAQKMALKNVHFRRQVVYKNRLQQILLKRNNCEQKKQLNQTVTNDPQSFLQRLFPVFDASSVDQSESSEYTGLCSCLVIFLFSH